MTITCAAVRQLDLDEIAELGDHPHREYLAGPPRALASRKEAS
jgi:hypothetical protein